MRVTITATMPAHLDWLEIAKIAVAAFTPIMTGVLSLLVLRMGTKVDAAKQLHQELIRKRLTLFEDIAPKLNDIFCFFQAIGHWAELTPEEVIKRKRAIDREVAVNRYLFHSDFWDAYRRFEEAHFDMFAAVGQPARLRIDPAHLKERVGEGFAKNLGDFASSKPGNHQEQSDLYHSLMHILGNEIKGT
jgi:hypothetical protein